MIKIFKYPFKQFLSSATGKALLSTYRGIGTVLMYHRVADSYHGEYEPHRALRVHPEAFEEQMHYASDHFEMVSVEKLVEHIKNGTSSKRHMLAVTFDDGYADNLQYALPVLMRYGIPATIFICNDFINRKRIPWWDLLAFYISKSSVITHPDSGNTIVCESLEQKNQLFYQWNADFKNMPPAVLNQALGLLQSNCDKCYVHPAGDFLSWDDVSVLAKNELVEIGAHTKSHFSLATCDEQTLCTEVASSIEEISQHTGNKTQMLAYPFGSSGEVAAREFELVKQSMPAVVAAFTTRFAHINPEHAKSLSALPRLAIDGNDTLDDFKRKLSGYDAFIAHKGRRIVTD